MGCVGSSAIKGVDSKSLLVPLAFKELKKLCPPVAVLLISKWCNLALHLKFFLGNVGLDVYGTLEMAFK